jgi:hypothetical protein
MSRRIRGVTIQAHPEFYQKLEGYRKQFRDSSGINLSQMQLTNLMAKQFKMPTLNSKDFIGRTI